MEQSTYNSLDEVCARCGLTYGSHHEGTQPWPKDYCPGHQDRMDWKNGPGTVFKPSGIFGKVNHGTMAKQPPTKKETLMITERTLKKWRQEALQDMISPPTLATHDGVDEEFYIDEVRELSRRILAMTQELLDQHLLNRRS